MAELVVAVGAVFLAPLLQVAFDRISTSTKFIEFFKGKNFIKFDEEVLDRLNITLFTISDVLEDAQVKEGAEAIRRWLGKVRAQVNHADDLLDEFNTECLRLKLHKQTQADLKPSLKSSFIYLKLSLKPSDIKKIMPQLRKVTTRLEGYEKQIQRLGLQKLDPKKKYPYRAPSSSVVDKSQFFGRDAEKEKMIQRVLSDGGAPDVSMIAITGMGGIGKTTLAQLVYNDDRVKKKFQTRAWVCVSEEYDALRITKALLMEVNSGDINSEADLNHLQVKLKENLAGKCFLIILDDIWNENPNDWSNLKTPLNGIKGSKIIVTTRNEKVASMMQNEPFPHLQPMSEDQSWCLFKSQAFDNEDHTPFNEFETIGKKIVNKCNGLPLAIKTVAGALRSETNINEWHDFLSSEDWAAKGDILPALSLSYKHLPSDLKCCFAFCSLFPKDVPFDKDEVVLLWMANDLVKPSTQKAGRRCFEELKSRSFFESMNGEKYQMHDLINDLARSVSGNTCIRLENSQSADHQQSIQRENELPPELLHVSCITNSSSEISKWLKGIAQVHGLRTFLPIEGYRSTFSCSDMFPRLKRLRALNLSRHDISIVPDSIGDLKHLRLLNLALTNIRKLPNAMCKCLNLQTLILADCKSLVKLPEDMRLLINLQHLDFQGVGTPLIKNLATWLRYIENISVVVDKIHGNVLEQLDKLQLCHSLTIIGLGDTDVGTIERAEREELKNKSREELKDKSCIENLTLEWGGVAEFREDQLKKFVKLQPHTNIKKLIIKGYTGKRFHDWLGDAAYSNLESLSLEDCKNCFSLPLVGQLIGLKSLRISGMDGITEIGKEFYGDASTSEPFHSSVAFPSLTSLEISCCNNILSFPEGGLAAPNLKTLWVEKCEKIKSLPARMHTQLPSLTKLIIEECPEIECFPEGGLPSSLERLHIINCKKMRNCQTNWGLKTLPSLKEVHLVGFEDTLFPEEGLLPTTLQSLYIYEFSNLKSLNQKGLEHLFHLQSLHISYCHNLEYLPQQKFSSSLSTLYIVYCELVQSFPEGLASSLFQLWITGCPVLAGCIEREKGEDWPNVSHIRIIYIDGKIISSDPEEELYLSAKG